MIGLPGAFKGTLAKYGHKSFCRQTLIGGNYGLLQNENGTIVPNPDFWAADLFNRLMTGHVINGNSIFLALSLSLFKQQRMT